MLAVLTKELRRHVIKLWVPPLALSTTPHRTSRARLSMPCPETISSLMLCQCRCPALLYKEMQERLLLDVDLADIHGQHNANFQHAAISRDDSIDF
jgi:hypothetical protein